jgi:hypothetical protein
MNEHDDKNRESEPVDPAPDEDTGFTSGGGPAAVIYGEGDDDKADEIGEGMLKAPDEER